MQITDPAALAVEARKLAEFLATFPEGVEPPTHYSIQWGAEAYWLLIDEESQKDRTAAIVRGLGGHWDKDAGNRYMKFATVHPSGVNVHVTVEREQVCKRIVTGTREITKTVPDPAAPLVEVVETVEDVEWECEPLLAGASA